MAAESIDFPAFVNNNMDRILGYSGIGTGVFSWAALENALQTTLLLLSIVFVILGIIMRIKKIRGDEKG